MPNFSYPYLDTFGKPHACEVAPTPVSNPKFIIFNHDLMQEIGGETLSLELLSGNQPKHKHYATRYGGHQFGHWAGQLGDGRAIFLGELNNQEIQLKGAGQ